MSIKFYLITQAALFVANSSDDIFGFFGHLFKIDVDH